MPPPIKSAQLNPPKTVATIQSKNNNGKPVVMVVADLKRCGFRRRFENLAALRPPPCPGGGYLAYRQFDVQIRITTRTPPPC